MCLVLWWQDAGSSQTFTIPEQLSEGGASSPSTAFNELKSTCCLLDIKKAMMHRKYITLSLWVTYSPSFAISLLAILEIERFTTYLTDFKLLQPKFSIYVLNRDGLQFLSKQSAITGLSLPDYTFVSQEAVGWLCFMLSDLKADLMADAPELAFEKAMRLLQVFNSVFIRRI